jgi:hypothetical protein
MQAHRGAVWLLGIVAAWAVGGCGEEVGEEVAVVSGIEDPQGIGLRRCLERCRMRGEERTRECLASTPGNLRCRRLGDRERERCITRECPRIAHGVCARICSLAARRSFEACRTRGAGAARCERLMAISVERCVADRCRPQR